ncbi:uncharacterized protein LAJ45_03733 [Morchella importuna]|uniref:uncharacterized protein n=1 Tax=Morchella importuna TaxID=1174673 RepID=UPI001E8DD421|nr:uncharacterized protein LAJ45_03733 [Morchella importuna]KAH8152306.1 hypothetical protein LAJ45_03733 [Morchella importuna]
MSELMSAEAQERVLFMRQQCEEALSMFDTMSLELESKIAIHEGVLKGVRSTRAERNAILEEQLSRLEGIASRMEERASEMEEMLRTYRLQ